LNFEVVFNSWPAYLELGNWQGRGLVDPGLLLLLGHPGQLRLQGGLGQGDPPQLGAGDAVLLLQRLLGALTRLIQMIQQRLQSKFPLNMAS